MTLRTERERKKIAQKTKTKEKKIEGKQNIDVLRHNVISKFILFDLYDVLYYEREEITKQMREKVESSRVQTHYHSY